MQLTVHSPSFSCHQITSKEDIPFSIEDYSRFKYGSKKIARIFGRELADAYVLSDEYKHCDLDSCRIVVLSSPYSFIPTATYAMKDYFVARLNFHLIMSDRHPVQECKVVREHSYIEDYGEMSADRRGELISREKFHTDREFLKDKHLIFLDDIKITGAHQKGMEEMIYRLGISKYSDYSFLYYAELINPGVDPALENHLNYAHIKDLIGLNDLIHNDEFMFNTRNVKFMLGSHPGEFNMFIAYQSKAFRETLFTCVIGNSYHMVPDYKINFNVLKRLVTNEH
jgi:hypothetical protein